MLFWAGNKGGSWQQKKQANEEARPITIILVANVVDYANPILVGSFMREPIQQNYAQQTTTTAFGGMEEEELFVEMTTALHNSTLIIILQQKT